MAKYLFSSPSLYKIEANLGVKQLNQTGSIVYEYNPLKVFRINSDRYVRDSQGTYLKGTFVTNGDKGHVNGSDGEKYTIYEYLKFGESKDEIYLDDENETPVNINDVERYICYPKNSILDLDSDMLEFDLSHPVDILAQPSYDGTVNLILNDGVHQPRLINSRFSPTGMNTYQIVDREGDNDTNIYDENSFDTDISLYKKTNNIVKLSFTGLSTNGNLKVGNYVFYFKLADSDGNETDFVAESGIVSCHIGNLNDPFSIRGGVENENSFKGVNFIMSNIDSSYNYVSVYYTRSSGSFDGTESTTAYKITKQFAVYNNIAKIFITGFENVIETSINEINTGYNIVESAKAQTQCQNMLFLGNVNNPNLEYKELADLSLHFLPHLNVSNSIGFVDQNYRDDSGGYEYYNADNIYNRLGYWDGEIYRFGVVYILNDYTLSPVFNVRGVKDLNTNTTYNYYPVYDNGGNRNYITVDKETYRLEGVSDKENSKGVVKLNYGLNQLHEGRTVPIGLDFKIDSDAVSKLKEYTKGFFFVRQRRIKTTFCQAVSIGLDIVSHVPLLKISDSSYMAERFLDDDRVLVHDFARRMWTNYGDGQVLSGYAALCPEYEVNQAYFNQFFTGTDFVAVKAPSKFKHQYFNRSGPYLYNLEYDDESDTQEYQFTITAVADDIKVIKGKNQMFSSRAGEAEDATKIAYCGYKNKSTTSSNLMRGCFGPYLGLEGTNALQMSLLNIKIPNYDVNSMDSYFDIRYRDSSSFYSISDRISWDDVTNKENIKYENQSSVEVLSINNIYRGDCFICNFTHRMIRNFQDSETPTNDEIIDSSTWSDNYEVGGTNSAEERAKINRADVNAVKIGHWVTVKVLSNINLSLRCTDPSYTTETGLTGRVRGFYPLQSMDPSGESKIPESGVSNAGLSKSVSEKYHFELPDVPAIKNKFNTRIMYSDISVNDAYKNGYRVFRNTNYRDYPATYGSITKIIEWSGNIVCIFEHGAAVIPVNERAIAANGAGGNAFITTSNVLPENPVILSSTFGSQWSESIIKTPYGIYGVDTVAKKIWKISISGGSFQLVVISDFKVQRFLNENITLSEHELEPIIGIRNVKSHYNAFKNDIMFTFYDDINTIEEKAWNLCYNEILGRFITFYSWIPSYSENIDNIFFSFGRSTSKNIAKLYSDTSLIQLTGRESNIIESNPIDIEGRAKIGILTINNVEDIYTFSKDKYSDITSGKALLSFEIVDNTVNGRFFIDEDNKLYTSYEYYKESGSSSTIWKIPIKATIKMKAQNTTNRATGDIEEVLYATLTLASEKFMESENNTYFWKHGQAGLMKTTDKIKPCMWYGKQHPFEFEVVVADNPAIHKIFTDLQIISNKTEPESLHFEISGEVYNFADDKKNMFFRQEAVKNLYQYNGGDILYDSKYLDILPEQRDIPYSSTKYKDKSTMFPIYYSRVDTINEIEDYYQSVSSIGRDYQRMSGSEIVYDELMNQFNIVTHIKACPFGGVYYQKISSNKYDNYREYNNFVAKYTLDDGSTGYVVNKNYNSTALESMYKNVEYFEIKTYGRLNGNMDYLEDRWLIQIPSIVYKQKNELGWTVGSGTKYPPLCLCNNPLPESMSYLNIDNDNKISPNLTSLGYSLNTIGSFDCDKWSNTKETRIRDKYIRVKIRYTGNNLAVIYALRTFYTVSYA